MKYRNNEDGLNMFSNAMHIALEKHEPKKEDSWVRCNIEFLEDALLHEIEEYKNTNNPYEKVQELADIANFCMMLYHRHIEKRNLENDFKHNRPHIKNIFFTRSKI